MKGTCVECVSWYVCVIVCWCTEDSESDASEDSASDNVPTVDRSVNDVIYWLYMYVCYIVFSLHCLLIPTCLSLPLGIISLMHCVTMLSLTISLHTCGMNYGWVASKLTRTHLISSVECNASGISQTLPKASDHSRANKCMTTLLLQTMINKSINMFCRHLNAFVLAGLNMWYWIRNHN